MIFLSTNQSTRTPVTECWNAHLWLLKNVFPTLKTWNSRCNFLLSSLLLKSFSLILRSNKTQNNNIYFLQYRFSAPISPLKFSSRICKLVQTSWAYSTCQHKGQDVQIKAVLRSSNFLFLCVSIRLRENLTKQTNSYSLPPLPFKSSPPPPPPITKSNRRKKVFLHLDPLFVILWFIRN